MKHCTFPVFALLLLVLAVSKIGARAQTVDPLAGSWTLTETYTTPPNQFVTRNYIFDSGEVLFVGSNFVVTAGSYMVTGQDVTITINANTSILLDYTGKLTPSNNDLSGTFTGQVISGTPKNVSGSFKAHRDGAPVDATGKLTYRELDSQFVYKTATGSDVFDFSVFKVTVSGSISLAGFPTTDPNNLMLSPDTELDVKAGGLAIFGGKLSEADPHSTDAHKLFKLLPFAPDSFFDPLPKGGPRGYRTGDPTLTIAWSFTGPHDKPTGLKFSIIAVARVWALNFMGGTGNSQGIVSPDGADNLGKPSQKKVFGTPSGNPVPCTITLADGVRQVSASFNLAGSGQTTSKSGFDPKLKVELKTSTFSEHGSGPEKIK